MTAEPALPMPGIRSLLDRLLVQPVLAQLRQGITADKIALTLALGFVLSIFPILGSTTLLCGAAGICLRLNQPLIQAANYIGYPIQIALLIPFYRAGESLFGQPHVPLSIPLFIARIHEDFFKFLRDYGRVALEGIAVWCLLAPFVAGSLYLALRPLLRRAASRLPSHA